MLSKTAMIPELNVGVVVLTNALPGGYTYFTLAQAILDAYLEIEPRDWNEVAFNAIESNQGNADSVLNAVWETVEKAKKKKIEYTHYTGMYEDDWFGKVEIYTDSEGKGTRMMIRALRSPKLHGEMFFYKATTFAVKWDYTDMECDAFATFSLDEEGKAVGLKMKGISPLIDFSFDFHDLDLKRVKE